MHVCRSRFSTHVIYTGTCKTICSIMQFMERSRKSLTKEGFQRCGRPAYMHIHIYRQLQLVHSEEEHNIAWVARQGRVRKPYLEGGKGAQHVKGMHELLVLKLAALTCPASCTLALLPLALLLQPSICILNICSKAPQVVATSALS